MPHRHLLIGILALLSVSPSTIAHGAEKVPSIKEVKTLADLENVAPLLLKNGAKVRLGVERTQCPVGDGVLLYCLTEGFQPPDEWSRADLMGPVIVVLRNSREPGLVLKMKAQPVGDDNSEYETFLTLRTGFGWAARQRQERGLDRCKLLFVRSVFVDRAGKLPIQIYEHRADTDEKDKEVGRLLAESTLIGTDQAYHPWMPFDIDYDVNLDIGDKPEIVMNRSKGIALPWLPDMRATVVKGLVNGKITQWQPKKELPTLIPSKPTGSLNCSIKGDLVTIDSEIGLQDGVCLHFLTRWWVNDKPFVTKQVSVSELEYPLDFNRSDKPVRRFQFRLDLNRKALKAKAGDRIGLQLLYCPDWDWVDSSRSKIAKGWKGNDWPMLSNRIEFVAD